MNTGKLDGIIEKNVQYKRRRNVDQNNSTTKGCDRYIDRGERMRVRGEKREQMIA